MKIITITLNPAFDLHCYCDDFKPFSESLCDIISCDSGGKGINISRALTANDVPNTALSILGEENAGAFLKALKKENINCKYITVSGRIRENITVHTFNKPETRISFSGFSINHKTIKQFEEILFKENFNNSIVVFTGRIPNGINKEVIIEMLSKVKNCGAKLVIDSKSFYRADLIDLKPFLIKPNEEEISAYTKLEVTDLESALFAAKEIRALGIENVIISLGALGAVLCCNDGDYIAIPPEIDVRSTVGAGDSMIAGFLSGISKGYDFEEALRLSVAYGSAACTTIGTNPPPKDIINSILEKTIAKKI